MMGKTHKAAGCLAMLLAFHYLEVKGYLLEGVNPLVQLAVMYPACSWGSTAPDLDQGDDAIPEKTPISILIHKIIHLGKVRHRSWQTHSPWMFMLICGILWGALLLGINYVGAFGSIDFIIIRLILTGFTVGFASHLVADTFTYQGIPIGGKKFFRLVPKKDMFKTNTTYETVVRRLIYVAIVLVVGFMIYQKFVQR